MIHDDIIAARITLTPEQAKARKKAQAATPEGKIRKSTNYKRWRLGETSRPTPIGPGLRFGDFIVVRRVENDKNGGPRWLLKCDCGEGEQIIRKAGNLRNSPSRSCGCANRIKVGDCFGKFTVMARAPESKTTRGGRWLCQCDCGGTATIRTSVLRGGKNKGCIRCSKWGSPDGPVSPQEVAERNYFAAEVRPAIFQRDSFTCVICGKLRCRNMAAHHIKPRSKYPKLYLDPSNVVTLCGDCHYHRAHDGNWHKINPVVAEYLQSYITNHHDEPQWQAILAAIQAAPKITEEERIGWIKRRRAKKREYDAKPENRARADKRDKVRRSTPEYKMREKTRNAARRKTHTTIEENPL